MSRNRATRHSRPDRRSPQDRAQAFQRMTQPLHRLSTYDLLTSEGIELIHSKSLEILSQVGIAFYDDEVLALLKEHGASINGDIATFDPALVEEWIALAPSQFTQLARNPQNNVQIGGDAICFAPVYGPPYVLDHERGRREAVLQDFDNFVKMAYFSPFIHHSGGTIVEPTDLPTHTRHLDMVYSHVRHSDKAFMGSVTSAENAADSVRMAELVFGREAMQKEPGVLALINISSPRRLDDRMLGALKVYARARQALLITPFILSGAMAPVSVAGTLVQLNAEALAGITLAQMINPGVPCIYGAFQTSIDLQNGAPVFGSPESQLTLFASAQLARRYHLPFRSGGMFCSSKIPDAQAAYESLMVMLPAILARVNFILHAAGWLEGGLTAGYEKFVLDCQLLGAFETFLKGLDLSAEGLAMEAIREVAPGGHHLGTAHTMAHFRHAFYRAGIFDYGSFEQWREEGSEDAYSKAATEVKRWLKAYERPPLDPAIDEALQAFMARRKKEIKPSF